MTNFNFDEDYVLENETVLLRPLRTSDFHHLLPYSIHEPELWKYSLLNAHGEENLKKYIAFTVEKRYEKEEYPFIVFDKRAKKYAGTTRFYDFQEFHRTTKLGYTWYGKEFQGTGLNKNCKYLLLEFAFESLGLERVAFWADNTNERSIGAMKSIGCKVEGILRSNRITFNGRRDTIVLSILSDEWFTTVKHGLLKKIHKEKE